MKDKINSGSFSPKQNESFSNTLLKLLKWLPTLLLFEALFLAIYIRYFSEVGWFGEPIGTSMNVWGWIGFILLYYGFPKFLFFYPTIALGLLIIHLSDIRLSEVCKYAVVYLFFQILTFFITKVFFDTYPTWRQLLPTILSGLTVGVLKFSGLFKLEKPHDQKEE